MEGTRPEKLALGKHTHKERERREGEERERALNKSQRNKQNFELYPSTSNLNCIVDELAMGIKASLIFKQPLNTHTHTHTQMAQVVKM